MSRFYRLVIFIAVLCGFVTIAPASATAQQSYAPNGLQGPADIVSGIYTGNDAGSCCWLGPRGEFKVRVPFGADTLLVNVIEPDYAVKGSTQSLRVQIDGHRPQTQCCFGPGEYEFTFSLPHDVKEHPLLDVRLWAGATFIPRAIGLNPDPRHLSMLIRGVAFSNSLTGTRFDASTAALQSGPMIWVIIGGIVVLALTLRRPIYGAAALIMTDPFLLAHNVHGTTITLPKAAIVAVALGLALKMRRAPGAGTAFWFLLGAQLLFVVSMVLSSVHAMSHGPALRETLKALEYAATLVVAYLAYRADADEGIIRTTLAVAVIIVSGLALAQEFLGAPQAEMIAGHAVARIAGPLEGPNQLAGYLGVMVPAMLAFAVLRRPLVLERIAIAAGCVTCLLTFSKGGVAALAFAAIVLFAVRYAPRVRNVTGGLTGAAFTAIFLLALASFTGALNGSATAHIFGATDAASRFNGGLGTRPDLWHGAYELWKTHPLTGIGPGNFELQIGRYDPGVRTHANSMYFQALAEQGIAGLIAMLAVVAASILVFVRRLNQPLALGACMAAVVMAFHQIFDCMWIYPKVGIMWWLLLAIAAAAVDLSRAAEHVAERAVA